MNCAVQYVTGKILLPNPSGVLSDRPATQLSNAAARITRNVGVVISPRNSKRSEPKNCASAAFPRQDAFTNDAGTGSTLSASTVFRFRETRSVSVTRLATRAKIAQPAA